MAPTYFRREPGIVAPTAGVAPHLFPWRARTTRSGLSSRPRRRLKCRLVPAICAFRLASYQDVDAVKPGTTGMTEPADLVHRKPRFARPPPRGAMRCRPSAQIGRGGVAARASPGPIRPARGVGLHAAQERDQSAAADAALADDGATWRCRGGRRGQPLVMRAWSFHAPLEAGVWGISERSTADYPEVYPDILSCRFWRSTGRPAHRLWRRLLDMTIAGCVGYEAHGGGIAFAAQEVPEVPATERDARLDLVLTENELSGFKADFCEFYFRRHCRTQRARHRGRAPARAHSRLETRFRRHQRRERRRRLRHHRNDLQRFRQRRRDAVTLGNHCWDQKEALVFIERAPASSAR